MAMAGVPSTACPRRTTTHAAFSPNHGNKSTIITTCLCNVHVCTCADVAPRCAFYNLPSAYDHVCRRALRLFGVKHQDGSFFSVHDRSHALLLIQVRRQGHSNTFHSSRRLEDE